LLGLLSLTSKGDISDNDSHIGEDLGAHPPANSKTQKQQENNSNTSSCRDLLWRLLKYIINHNTDALKEKLRSVIRLTRVVALVLCGVAGISDLLAGDRFYSTPHWQGPHWLYSLEALVVSAVLCHNAATRALKNNNSAAVHRRELFGAGILVGGGRQAENQQQQLDQCQGQTPSAPSSSNPLATPFLRDGAVHHPSQPNARYDCQPSNRPLTEQPITNTGSSWPSWLKRAPFLFLGAALAISGVCLFLVGLRFYATQPAVSLLGSLGPDHSAFLEFHAPGGSARIGNGTVRVTWGPDVGVLVQEISSSNGEHLLKILIKRMMPIHQLRN